MPVLKYVRVFIITCECIWFSVHELVDVILVYLKRTNRSNMFRLLLSHPEAEQDWINSKCTTVSVILLKLRSKYLPQLLYLQDTDITNCLCKHQLLMMAANFYSGISQL